MPGNDPYSTLGVERGATQDAIKDAYRKLAKKFHPDLNPGNKQAEARFKEISSAYEKIGNPEARAKFDRGETEGEFQSGARGGGPFYHETQRGPGSRYTYRFNGDQIDPDVFESIFGNMGGGGGFGGAHAREPFQARGEDHVYKMPVELRDAILGGEKQLTLPTGKRLEVKIPPGVRSGMKLRFAGQGGEGIQGGPPGDALVELDVLTSSEFKIEGDQLISELTVPLDDAVLGAEVDVPTIEGRVKMRIPPGVNEGSKLRLAGKGGYVRPGGRRGDQIVVLRLKAPEPMDNELKEALRLWRERHHKAAGAA